MYSAEVWCVAHMVLVNFYCSRRANQIRGFSLAIISFVLVPRNYKMYNAISKVITFQSHTVSRRSDPLLHNIDLHITGIIKISVNLLWLCRY